MIAFLDFPEILRQTAQRDPARKMMVQFGSKLEGCIRQRLSFLELIANDDCSRAEYERLMDTAVRYVVVLRDGRDAFMSLQNHMARFRPDASDRRSDRAR